MKVYINVDGGSRGNPGPGGAGVVIRDAATNAVIYEAAVFLGKVTNNVAEYSGLTNGLKKALELGADTATVFSDSELLVFQMTGKYRVKNPGLLPLYEEAKLLEAQFLGCTYKHIPREQNGRADALANKAMDEKRSSQRKLQKATTQNTEGTKKEDAEKNEAGSALSPSPRLPLSASGHLPFSVPSQRDKSAVKSSGTHHLACCQFDIAWENAEANIAKVSGMLTGAAVPPGSLIALPEMFATGFSMNVPAATKGAAAAEAFLADAARKHRATIIGGVSTPAEAAHGRNQAIGFDDAGKEVCRFTKLHPFSYAREQEHYLRGDDVQLFDWNGVAVAPLICYDLRFPEAFRRAVRQGAKLILVLANWPTQRDLHWAAMLRARAIENLCYVAGVNRTGKSPHNAYAGHSMIVGPRGEMLAEAGDEECLLRANLDFAALDAYRAEFPALDDIRPEFLGS